MTEETKETANAIAVRRDLINALESKIVGARVAHARAKERYHQLMEMGCSNAAAIVQQTFVECELIIHNYREKLDAVRGWSM